MNHYDALKLLALRAVMKPDAEAQYRSICRWYSKTFHTPLHAVDELPEEDVLTAYFEDRYEDMEEAEREDALKSLLESKEDRKARQRAKDAEDAEAFEFAQRLAAEERQKQAQKKVADVQVEKKPSMLSAASQRESRLPQEGKPAAFEKLEPDVSIKFMDASEFEKELEGFGMMSPKEGK